MFSKKLASAVLTLSLFLSLFNYSVVSAEGREEQYVSAGEAICYPTHSEDEPISLVEGTALWAIVPSQYSENGLLQFVGIASPYGGWTNTCWLEIGTFSPGTGWVFYDGYVDPASRPSFEPIGETFVNTDEVLCQRDLTEDSEIYTLDEGTWVTMLDDEGIKGWQYVIASDENGDHFGCYVEEVYLGGETTEEPAPEIEPEPELQPEAETEVESEVAPEELEPQGEEPTWQEESSGEAVEVVDPSAPVEEEIAPATEVVAQAPGVITGLPSTGVGDDTDMSLIVFVLATFAFACAVVAFFFSPAIFCAVITYLVNNRKVIGSRLRKWSGLTGKIFWITLEELIAKPAVLLWRAARWSLNFLWRLIYWAIRLLLTLLLDVTLVIIDRAVPDRPRVKAHRAPAAARR